MSSRNILGVLDAIIAVSSITLRLTSFLFLRYHPLGNRYLRRIYWSFAIYALGTLSQSSITFKRHIQLPRRRGLGIVLAWIDSDRPWPTVLGFFINVGCLTAVIDFIYRGHLLHQSQDLAFSRVGYVDSTSARIVARAPIEEFVEITVSSSEPSDGAEIRSMVFLETKNDFVGTFYLEGLKPNTSYSYFTNASHAGSFRTVARIPTSLTNWSLISASCIKPFFPYNPLHHGLRIPGLEYLDDYLSSNPADMMLFLGDFIYIDLPVPFGWDAQAYTTAYRQVYASPSWTSRLRNLPWLHVYDDHEIINDWAKNETGLYQTAMMPFWNYHGNANPPSVFGPGKTHFIFRRGEVAFFVLDTRRYRSDNSAPDGPEKTMLGREQLWDLKQWLVREAHWKVVVSSVPFTRNWRGPDAADSWAGYLWERDVILDLMKRTGGAVILSGDRHEHATTLFPAKFPGGKPVIEFSTSPLNQFYEPFDRFHKEVEDTDVSVYSHPWGTSKFGVVSFDTSHRDRLLLRYNLFVDGANVWDYEWESRKASPL